MTYPKTGPDVPPSPRFPAIEREVIDFWKSDDTFRASIENREGAPAREIPARPTLWRTGGRQPRHAVDLTQ